MEWIKKNVIYRDETRRAREKREEAAKKANQEELERRDYDRSMSNWESTTYQLNQYKKKKEEEEKEIADKRLNEERKQQTQFNLENTIAELKKQLQDCENNYNELLISQKGGKTKSKRRSKKIKSKRRSKK